MDRQVCVIKTVAYSLRTDRHTDKQTQGQTKVKKLRDLRSCQMISFTLWLCSLAVQFTGKIQQSISKKQKLYLFQILLQKDLFHIMTFHPQTCWHTSCFLLQVLVCVTMSWQHSSKETDKYDGIVHLSMSNFLSKLFNNTSENWVTLSLMILSKIVK